MSKPPPQNAMPSSLPSELPLSAPLKLSVLLHMSVLPLWPIALPSSLLSLLPLSAPLKQSKPLLLSVRFLCQYAPSPCSRLNRLRTIVRGTISAWLAERLHLFAISAQARQAQQPVRLAGGTHLTSISAGAAWTATVSAISAQARQAQQPMRLVGGTHLTSISARAAWTATVSAINVPARIFTLTMARMQSTSARARIYRVTSLTHRIINGRHHLQPYGCHLRR